jgi:hypothetical protein
MFRDHRHRPANRLSRYCPHLWLLLLVGFASLDPPVSWGERPPRTFQLVAPGLPTPSIASIDEQWLVIQDPAGQETAYQRAPRFDSADGAWIGYSSQEAQQVIRWPASFSGPMQIGRPQAGRITFTTSRMRIEPLPEEPPADRPAPPPPRPGLTFDPSGQERPTEAQVTDASPAPPIQLSLGDATQRQFLTATADRQLRLAPAGNDPRTAWHLSPAGDNLFRLQQRIDSSWYAIGLDPRRVPGGATGRSNSGDNVPLELLPLAGGPEQLWRITPYRSGYYFESVRLPGLVLTWSPAGGFHGSLTLQPLTYATWQVWFPQRPTFELPAAVFRGHYQQQLPQAVNEPIPVRLVNSQRQELLLLITDRRRPEAPLKLRLAAGGQETVYLERDPGATIVETFEFIDPLGNWSQQQFVTELPPSVLYDVSVYEIFLQSIAIDRTGKSPSPVEDINMQPRSLGFFLIPAGNQLAAGSVIDAYRIATGAGNPGAARRLSEADRQLDGDAPADDPLRAILESFISEYDRATLP